jgi:hypothetical protein
MTGHEVAVLLATLAAAIFIIRFWKAILLFGLTLMLAGALFGLVGIVEYVARTSGH